MGIFSVMEIPEIVLRYIFTVFAIYRLTHAFALETGPFAIFVNIREWVIKKYDNVPDAWQVQFVQCPLCQSFWGALLGSLIVFPIVTAVDVFLIWGSLAGGVLILHLWLYRK